jgi:(p)ppGpp synthase/HD superfamily hydrolase
LELVAAAVFAQAEGHAGRVTPDRKDAENLRDLLLTETKDWRALAIRSAASLYRLRGLIKANQPELTREAVRTAREALNIYAPLASRMGMHRLKNELEGTAFRILYRRQYKSVTSLRSRSSAGKTYSKEKDLAGSMQMLLDNVKSEMVTMLNNDKEFQNQAANFSVTARVKEPYSMWKKMLRLGYNHVLQVPDALALRIVLDAKKLTPDEPQEVTQARERALCYYAQKLCLEKWKPNPTDPRYKDYIEKPKRNGYQSLHYTAKTNWDGEDWSLEFQIRSGEMHKVAEFGLASHWDYKAQQKKNRLENSVRIEKEGQDIDRSSDAYLCNVQKWQWQQHGNKLHVHDLEKWDTNPAALDAALIADAMQDRARADRIRARAARLKPYLQALTAAQSDLARDHVFVFLI